MKIILLRFFAVFGVVLLLSACQLSPRGLETTERTIQDLSKISAQDSDCQCHDVRLGGKVLNAKALTSKTRIEVLSFPIAHSTGKPEFNKASNGRFIAYIDGFVDPETLYNQYITISGMLVGMKQGKIDQANYDFPEINVSQFKTWHITGYYQSTGPRIGLGLGMGSPNVGVNILGPPFGSQGEIVYRLE